jgi:hypothetical protein
MLSDSNVTRSKSIFKLLRHNFSSLKMNKSLAFFYSLHLALNHPLTALLNNPEF